MAYCDRNQPRGAWMTSILGGSLLALMAVQASAAEPCTIGARPWLSLTISAGLQVAVADRSITVRVHDNGCAELHRPAFYRDAGDYRLQLRPEETAALRAQVRTEPLAGFDAHAVNRQLSAAQAKRAGARSGAAEQFTVMDADLYQIQWDAGEKLASAAWPAVHDYAEFYPSVLELKQLSKAVRAVQALLDRGDAVPVQGVTP